MTRPAARGAVRATEETLEMPEITVKLPDGSEKQVPEGATVLDVAAAIGPRLAQAALAGKVNGEPGRRRDHGRCTVTRSRSSPTAAPKRSTSFATPPLT